MKICAGEISRFAVGVCRSPARMCTRRLLLAQVLAVAALRPIAVRPRGGRLRLCA